MFFTLTDRASTIYKYVVANPVRGLLDRKRSEGHLQSSNESIKTIQKRQNERNNITQSIGQKRVEEGHTRQREFGIVPAASHPIPSPNCNHALVL